MAKGTIYGSTGNEYIDVKIEWSSEHKGSQSLVTAKLYYKRNNSGFTTKGTGSFSITINGNTTSANRTLTITESAWVLAMDAIKYVTHDADGTKTVTISATGSIPDTTLTSTSCSGRATLDPLLIASTISSAGNITLGNACSVKWTPKSTALRYKIKFALGSWSYTTGAIHPNTTSAYTYKGYKIPLSVANQLPNAKTGTMTATLYTYSDSDATEQVGSASSETFTVTVPNNVNTEPSVSMTLAPVTSGTAFADLYLQGRSKVKATLSGEGKYGATITFYSVAVEGVSIVSGANPFTSGIIPVSGQLTVTGTAKDSRGYSNTVAGEITVIPYSKPSLSPVSGEKTVICARCDADGNLTESGTYLKIKAKRSYSKVKDGDTQKNFCTIRYRYRAESTTTFSSWSTLLSKDTTSTDTIDKTLSGIVSDASKSYVVQVGVVDDVGETSAIQFVIPTDFVTVDIPEKREGKRVGIGRYAEESDEPGVDMGMPIHGGMVDNLTLGELLTATSAAPIDLNNYKTAGNYYSNSADNSAHISNTPYNEGGFGLIVREMQSVNMIRQEIFYGRTNWQRHYNGSTGAWSDWLRYLMTDEPTSTAVDFVTETGVWYIDDADPDLGYWRYRKWKSGAVDLNGVFKVTPELDSTQSSVVRYSKQVQIALPFKVETFQFVGTPGTNFFLLTNAAVVTDANGNNKAAFRLFRFVDFAGDSTYVRIIASGKYV